MKTVKINFVDFWPDLEKENNQVVNILKKHFNVVISEEPDYLFYSCCGDEHYKYNCIRIFYTGECKTPDFNECDYAIGFDRINFGDRYIRFPIYKLKNYWEPFINRNPISEEILLSKTEFCSFVCSNETANFRKNFFDKLSQYKQVNSGGRYLNNVGGPVANKLEFQKKHKFAMAFENAVYPGYVTEKITDAFAANAIPIYFGAPDIEKDFNKKAFINCNDFNSFDEAIDFVKEIDNNEKLYWEMLNENPLIENENFSEFEDFIVNIFSQDLKKAKRRASTSFSSYTEKIIVDYNTFKENNRFLLKMEQFRKKIIH